MVANKNDAHARDCWGPAYDDIPKSVWATLAWHLANAASGEADAPGAAERQAATELQALKINAIIPEKQAGTALMAINEATERKLSHDQ